MPPETNVQTSSPDGTVQSQTPPEETATAQVAEPTTPSASPADPDYKKKYSASSAENQRIRAENQRIAQENQYLRSILSSVPPPSATQQPVSTPPSSSSTGFNYNDLTDAVLDRDTSKFQHFEDHLLQKAEERVMARQQQKSASDMRIAKSVEIATSVLKDADSPLAQASIQRYQQMLFDPSYAYIEPVTMDLQTPQGVLKVNPHLLRQAVIETKADFANRMTSAEIAARSSGDSFVEPADHPTPPDTTPKFDASKHLFAEERDYCNNMGTSYETYWKYMDPKLKDARIKAGRPILKKDV